MLDIFNNYPLQREELLARIAQELQLDKTRLERMESAYNAVAELLKNDKYFFDGLVIEVYAQGSKRIGATVHPINKADFDLDVVLHIFDPYHRYAPEEIYNALIKALEKDGYYKTILEKKKRCVRLNYKSDFHMDILPACMPNLYEKEMIKIPEKALSGWSSGNPKGFANWFLNIANSVKEPMLGRYAEVLLKAQIETERLPEEAYLKTPLQRVVQLFKRYRDIFFEKKDYPVSSIVITTLTAQFYAAENSIFEAMDNVVSKIKSSYLDSIRNNKKFKVLNPVNPEEDFTDSWTNEHYKSFFNFIEDFHKRWLNLKNSFEASNEDYIRLFGEGVYKESLNKQLKNYAKSANSPLERSSGLIAASIAFTSPNGNINSSNGYKNGSHHNFGGKY